MERSNSQPSNAVQAPAFCLLFFCTKLSPGLGRRRKLLLPSPAALAAFNPLAPFDTRPLSPRLPAPRGRGDLLANVQWNAEMFMPGKRNIIKYRNVVYQHKTSKICAVKKNATTSIFCDKQFGLLHFFYCYPTQIVRVEPQRVIFGVKVQSKRLRGNKIKPQALKPF